MATWPASLPQELRIIGFSESGPSGNVRTEMDAGPAFVRNRYSAVPDEVPGTQVLSKAQVATLDAFYKTTLMNGSLAFTWTHPRTGVSAELQFTARPQFRPRSGDVWEVTLPLEVLP